ncbi:MAG: zinc-binding dehydrogenase [Thermoanaerobaculaceae bacterium]|nr:zinc-binding dehydrogenase [Thermoanaerobaculaceae bacterium]
MRGWQAPRYGGPDVLRLHDLPEPHPGPGEVVVRVRAIGLNFADCMARQGVYPRVPAAPFVPGMEVAGEVTAVGDGVADPRPGARVVAVPIFGGHAESVRVPARFAYTLPSSIDWTTGASLAVTGVTANHALFTLGRLRVGDRVAVTAAAGGVGTMAIQMAVNAGARVLAVASTPEKQALARQLGAHDAVGYDGYRDALASGIDVVLDSVGGALFLPGWRALRPDGRYILFGFAVAAGRRSVRRLWAGLQILRMGWLSPYPLVSQCRTLAGFNLSLVPHLAGELRERFASLLALVTVGELKPVIGAVYPFAELPKAHAFLQSRASTGKVVVTIP